jgi:AcrR family transcriptional regulator
MAARTYAGAKRTASTQQTRERLISAATDLLKSPNQDETFSLEAVAKAAKVTRLTVYKQFGCRAALLEAAFDRYAAEGGLANIPRAISQPDPHDGLMALIDIFCDFWVRCARGADRLHAYALDDPELRDALQERNERRRHLLCALLGRMVETKNLPAKAFNDMVDTLFALTGFQFYNQLQHAGRSPKDVKKIIHNLADAALVLSSPKSVP